MNDTTDQPVNPSPAAPSVVVTVKDDPPRMHIHDRENSQPWEVTSTEGEAPPTDRWNQWQWFPFAVMPDGRVLWRRPKRGW